MPVQMTTEEEVEKNPPKTYHEVEFCHLPSMSVLSKKCIHLDFMGREWKVHAHSMVEEEPMQGCNEEDGEDEVDGWNEKTTGKDRQPESVKKLLKITMETDESFDFPLQLIMSCDCVEGKVIEPDYHSLDAAKIKTVVGWNMKEPTCYNYSFLVKCYKD